MRARATRIRHNDPEGLRARILDAAADLFQTNGYHSTGMREIMEATRVTSGALHHHFPTKDALALAVIRDRVMPDVRETWIDPIRTQSPLGRTILRILAEIIRGIEQRGSVRGCPLNNLAMELSLTDPKFRDAIQEIFVDWQAALVERIAQTRGGAKLDRAKRATAAAFIVATYSGAMNMAKTMQSATPLRMAANALSRWLRERSFAA